MFKQGMQKLSLFVAFMVLSIGAWAADPTLHQVYQAAEAGNYREAQSMMDQVLRDHPNSAKAHFVEAELLAKQGRAAAAQTELAKAKQLEPGLSFAKPEAVQELTARIAALRTPVQSGSSYVDAPSHASNVPWGMLFIGMILIAAIFLFTRARQNARVGMSPYGGSPMNMPPSSGVPGYGPTGYGAGIPPTSGGMGSGIMGGLATGAAVGAGMVAGEALMHRVLEGGHHEDPYRQNNSFVDAPQPRLDDSNYDMGGNDFGVNDASSWDDSNFGGSDDWS